jgi:hypothetical protein
MAQKPKSEGVDMTILKIITAALTSALVSAFFTVWLMHGSTVDHPTLPPLLFSNDGGDQVIWGAWKTVQGFDAPGTYTTEIRCNKARMSCVEGVGVLLIHEKGQDLDSQAFEYRIDEWSEGTITATAKNPMAGCLQRRLSLNLKDETASLSWAPAEGCDGGDRGKAVLIGDNTEL